MKFESPDITFSVIDKAYTAKNIESLEEFEEIVTKQLIDAWKYTITTPEPFSYEMLLKLHAVIAKDQALSWGVLRDGEVGVSGTDFKPAIPTKTRIQLLLDVNEEEHI